MTLDQNAGNYPQPVPTITDLSFQDGWKSPPTVQTVPLDETAYYPVVNNPNFTTLPANTLAALRPVLSPALPQPELMVTLKGYWYLIGSKNFAGGSDGDMHYTKKLVATETSSTTLSREVETSISAAGKGVTGSVKGSITSTTSTSYTTTVEEGEAFKVAPNTTFIQAQWQWRVDVALTLPGHPDTPFVFQSAYRCPLPVGPSNTDVTIGTGGWTTIGVSSARYNSVTLPT